MKFKSLRTLIVVCLVVTVTAYSYSSCNVAKLFITCTLTKDVPIRDGQQVICTVLQPKLLNDSYTFCTGEGRVHMNGSSDAVVKITQIRCFGDKVTLDATSSLLLENNKSFKPVHINPSILPSLPEGFTGKFIVIKYFK